MDGGGPAAGSGGLAAGSGEHEGDRYRGGGERDGGDHADPRQGSSGAGQEKPRPLAGAVSAWSAHRGRRFRLRRERRRVQVRRPVHRELAVCRELVVFEEAEHLRPGQRRESGRRQPGEDTPGRDVTGQVRVADRAADCVLQHAGPDLRRHLARPAAGHLSQVRAGLGAPADQDLGGERPFQVLLAPVKENLSVLGRQAKHQAKVNLMPAGEFKRLELVGRQTRRREPRP
jgi:hypothetical protein